MLQLRSTLVEGRSSACKKTICFSVRSMHRLPFHLSPSLRRRCTAHGSFDIISSLSFRECSLSGFSALLLAASLQDHFKPSISLEVRIGKQGSLLPPHICSLLGSCQSLSAASGNICSGGLATYQYFQVNRAIFEVQKLTICKFL